tara:strand:- start:357 stop:551 length:195 start_codon:yes stop_codon:yes gene_type:complete
MSLLKSLQIEISSNHIPWLPNENIKCLHVYLKKHISVDGHRHGPLSIKLLDVICADEKRLLLNL